MCGLDLCKNVRKLCVTYVEECEKALCEQGLWKNVTALGVRKLWVIYVEECEKAVCDLCGRV